MRGYFGVGVERISKPMNMGAVMRTAHAFGASFFFTIDAHHHARETKLADTSKSAGHVPYYPFDGIEDLRLPVGCALVGGRADRRCNGPAELSPSGDGGLSART